MGQQAGGQCQFGQIAQDEERRGPLEDGLVPVEEDAPLQKPRHINEHVGDEHGEGAVDGRQHVAD